MAVAVALQLIVAAPAAAQPRDPGEVRVIDRASGVECDVFLPLRECTPRMSGTLAVAAHTVFGALRLRCSIDAGTDISTDGWTWIVDVSLTDVDGLAATCGGATGCEERWPAWLHHDRRGGEGLYATLCLTVPGVGACAGQVPMSAARAGPAYSFSTRPRRMKGDNLPPCAFASRWSIDPDESIAIEHL
ncbi:MAG: hypothetical protein WD993_08600 [Thermoleophilaceae bacterium]